MADVNSTAHQGRISIDVPNDCEIEHAAYCVALTGADGKVVPGSRLSEDFGLPTAAFAALSALHGKYQNAAVFCSAGLTA